MPQVFYLVRHGETDWNVQRRLQGHSDIALNSLGEQQAQSLRERMKNIHIDRVISSDLIRARRTAELGLSSLVTTTEDLREVHLGAAEGQTRDELILKYGPEFWEQWSSHQPQFLDVSFPQGETKRQLLARMLPCIHAHLDANPALLCAFVSHGLAMRTLTHFLRPGLADTQFVGNCGVLKLQRLASKEISLLEYYDPSQSVL
jgi:broad specificity phosphatase PhoE